MTHFPKTQYNARLMRGLASALLLPHLAAACAEAGPGRPEATVRDSAGITIVENEDRSFPDGGGWALTNEPLLQIGTLNGPEETQLFGVRTGARLSDGSIAVVNGQAPDLRIFAPDGSHRATFGRRGEGPGEFQMPSLTGVLPGDTIVVVDRRLRSINLFHPQEGFLRSISVDPALEGFLLDVGMFSDGSVVSWRMLPGGRVEQGFARRPARFQVVGPDGMLRQDFGEFPGEETVLHATQQGTTTFMTVAMVPFGKGAKRAVAGETFFYGSQDSYEIRALDPEGALQRLIRMNRPVMEVLPEHLEHDIALRAEMADTEDQARAIRQSRREMPVPDVHPAYGDIYADTMGFLWVEDYRLPGHEPTTLTIFDDEGKLAGSVTLPEGLDILEIGEDYLLGLYRDDLDVEHVRLYGLTRPG